MPFLEGGTAFQFACGRFLAQLAMGVFAARRLLSVLFAFAPPPPLLCAGNPLLRALRRSGAVFSAVFLHKKAGRPWFMGDAGAGSAITIYCP